MSSIRKPSGIPHTNSRIGVFVQNKTPPPDKVLQIGRKSEQRNGQHNLEIQVDTKNISVASLTYTMFEL